MTKYVADSGSGGICEFEVSGGRLYLQTDNLGQVDVTEFTLAGSEFTDPEQALIDLYTDQDGTEGCSIEKVEE